jgi:hypothetical protein
MLASAIPTKFAIPFANAAGGGYIRAIPQASQIGITNGAASLTDGFPPLTFLPVGSGGVPPFGQDFNGLLNQISAWSRWQCAGGPVAYDGTFQTAVGGYPAGAVVQGTATGTSWLSLTDNNITNPNTGGAGWQPVSGFNGGLGTIASAATTDIGSVSSGVLTVTGTTTITSLGTSMAIGTVKVLKFAAALTLTYNAGSLILPTSANIVTAAGDTALVACLSSGNYQVLMYQTANGAPLSVSAIGLAANLASAATTDLGTIQSHNVTVTGTATITSLGSSASAGAPLYYLTFAGAATLTHSASLLCPNQASLVTVAGATAWAIYAGSGNWTIFDYNTPGAAALPVWACGQLLYTSTTVVTLTPFKGNLITFPSGVTAKIPTAGIASTITSCYLNGTAAQTLTASTLYYAYLANVGTAAAPTWVIDFSATGHSTDANSGIEIKTGDATRVLVGMVYPATGPSVVDNFVNRLVATWNNRRPRTMQNNFTTTRSTSSASFVEINSEIRCAFVTWGDATTTAFAGSIQCSGTANGQAGISLDGALGGIPFTFSGLASTTANSSLAAQINPSEGFHYITLVGKTNSGTVNWNTNSGDSVLSATLVA